MTVSIAQVRPAPSPAEVAAIVAAIEAVWPRPAATAPAAPASHWRFSGRPWHRPPGWSTRGA